MAFAKNIGKNKIFFNLQLCTTQIINDPPPKKNNKKKTRKKTPLNAISDAQF
jgi:hypothetical protein